MGMSGGGGSKVGLDAACPSLQQPSCNPLAYHA